MKLRSYEEFREQLTYNVLRHMRRRKYSQAKLAVYSDLSQGTISGLLSGKRDPGLYTLWSVSRTLRVPIEDLIAPVDFDKKREVKHEENIDFSIADCVADVVGSQMRVGKHNVRPKP